MAPTGPAPGGGGGDGRRGGSAGRRPAAARGHRPSRTAGRMQPSHPEDGSLTLDTGQRLGSYEIVGPIGAGGMGEVYRATDTRLGRDVALKLLPEAFARDPDRLARFEREAKVLASLSHPNIAHLYGSRKPRRGRRADPLPRDGAGAGRGPRGAAEARAARRRRGARRRAADRRGARGRAREGHRPPRSQARQRQGDGRRHVKVLDFGLAKAWSGDAAAAGSSPDLSQSPTLAHAGTAAGLILGTAAYMSPEQARGKPVDKRADIWAFGVVLYEMLTGAEALRGRDRDRHARRRAHARAEPGRACLPATPPRVRRLLRALPGARPEAAAARHRRGAHRPGPRRADRRHARRRARAPRRRRGCSARFPGSWLSDWAPPCSRTGWRRPRRLHRSRPSASPSRPRTPCVRPRRCPPMDG